MKKVLLIAAREFLATVTTRGFIIGLLIVPALMSIGAAVAPRLLIPRIPQVHGQIAVIDQTGRVVVELRATLDPHLITERRAELARQALAAVPDEVRRFADGGGVATSDQTIAAALGSVPDFELAERPPTADVQREKKWLTEQDGAPHVALVVVHPDAVQSAGAGGYGAYDLYVPPNLDDRLENQIHQSLREAIVNARMRIFALDPVSIGKMVRVARVRSVTVSKGEERRTVGGLNRAVPFIFVMLLFVGVMVGGQSLLTSTIEEKSSRVIEVLLSAISPLELMAGKILGQMGVSLTALGLYVAVGMVTLLSFALFGLLDPWLLVYLVIFFIIADLVIGSLMMAVGAAVNDMQEAQSLMMPIIVVMVLPLMLVAPISADPNSTFSVIVSLIPPVNTFAMLIRLASNAPPPWWQVLSSIVVGIASVVAAIWFAAKVFRIGLLMYGKPPNFATLVRWARAA